MNNELLYIDELTGIYNRRYFKKINEDVINKYVKDRISFALIISDIDHFKEINDTYGHTEGDRTIKFFAEFLSSNLRKEDVVIRYGGDEFISLQWNLEKKDAHIIWQRMIEKLKHSTVNNLSLSMSVGIANYPEDGETLEDLFKVADSRLYQAKRSGRGRVGGDEQVRIRIPAVKFVDRTFEKDKLLSNIESGEITVIRGLAGVGKTRLVREVLYQLKDRDVLWADCLAFESKISYFPLRELVKYRLKRMPRIIDDLPKPYRIEIGKIVPYIMKGVNKTEVELFGEMVDRYRLYEGFNIVFSSGNRKKVIIIDNFQWIDFESLESLKYIFAKGDSNLVFVFLTRVEETTEQNEAFFRHVGMLRSVTEIMLTPLSDKHMREVVKIIMEASVPGLEKYIVRYSSGNIFFAEEIIKTLKERGYLKNIGHEWAFETPESNIAPKGIEDVVSRKVSRLSDDAREFIRVLSVAKKGYFNLLVELMGFNEGHILSLMDECIDGGLVKEDANYDLVEFQGELARDIVYRKEISGIRRRRLHGKIAKWLENNMRNGNEEEILFHYRMANVDSKVIEFGILAGDKARKLYANRDAVRYYAWVIEVLEKNTENEEKAKILVDILKKKAYVLMLMGLYKEAEEDVKKGMSISERFNLNDMRVDFMFAQANVLLHRADVHTVLDMMKDIIKESRYRNDKSVMYRVYRTIGRAYYAAGDPQKSLEFHEKGVKYAENEEQILKIYNDISIAYLSLENYTKAMEYLKKMRGFFNNVDNKKYRVIADLNLGSLYRDMFEYEKALSYYKEALKLANEIGDIPTKSLIYSNLMALYRSQGNVEKSEEYIGKAMRIAESIGKVKIMVDAYNDMGRICEFRGEYDKSLEYFKKAYKWAENYSWQKNMSVYAFNVAIGLMKLGKSEEGKRMMVYAVIADS